MNDKQDQYREYVVNKLLCETHIQYINMDMEGHHYKQVVINTPFQQQLFLIHSPKVEQAILQPFDIVPVQFYDIMEEYSITGDEVKEIWRTYGYMVGKMIDVEKCKVLDVMSVEQKTL